MIEFFLQYGGTIFVGAIIAAVAALIVFFRIKSRKNGKSPCGCKGCEGCGGACQLKSKRL